VNSGTVAIDALLPQVAEAETLAKPAEAETLAEAGNDVR
jgi:hypothetical protein